MACPFCAAPDTSSMRLALRFISASEFTFSAILSSSFFCWLIMSLSSSLDWLMLSVSRRCLIWCFSRIRIPIKCARKSNSSVSSCCPASGLGVTGSSLFGVGKLEVIRSKETCVSLDRCKGGERSSGRSPTPSRSNGHKRHPPRSRGSPPFISRSMVDGYRQPSIEQSKDKWRGPRLRGWPFMFDCSLTGQGSPP
jgi:hypothetical protein